MSKEKPVRKFFRSLPRKFDMKVTAIEEAHDISIITVDELVRLLQTFELAINDKFEKKNKSIAFVYISENKICKVDLDTEEGLSKTIVLLGKKFNIIIHIMD